MAQNIATFNGVNYDLNDHQQLANYIAVLQTAATANVAPVQMTPAQLANLAQQTVNALQPPQRGNPATIVNPITTTRNQGQNVFYEYEEPPAGWRKDAKEETIDAWNGTRMDVTPFLNRVQGVIAQKPFTFAYTKQRILFVLSLLKNTVAQQWAVNVKDAVVNLKDNDYYFDSWTGFKDEFKKRFGLRNETQIWFNKLVQLRQGENQDARSYLDTFEQYRQKANIPKGTAYQYLRGGINDTFRRGALFHPTRPNDYDTYVAYMLEYQNSLDEEKSYQQLAKGQTGFRPQNPSAPHPSSRFKLGPGHQPMDLSVVQQQRIQELRVQKQQLEVQELEEQINALKQKKKGKPSSRPNQPSSSKRPPPRPVTGRPPPPTQRLSPQEQERRARLRFCFKCAQPGHFARECPNRFINSVQDAEHTICQLDQLLNQALQFQEEGQDGDIEGQDIPEWEQEQPLGDEQNYDDLQSQVDVTDYLEHSIPLSGDLIDLNDPQQPTTQGF
jgi:hypothetical protein